MFKSHITSSPIRAYYVKKSIFKNFFFEKWAIKNIEKIQGAFILSK